MTTDRRLDHLEGGLPPKEGTLLWLAEAQQHGSLLAYCGWLVDRPLAEAPLVRLHDQAVREVRRVMRGEPLERRYAAEEQADRDVAFLFEVVMLLNVEAEKLVREGGLRYGMLFWEMRAISSEARDGDPDDDDPRPATAERWSRWRAAVAALLMDLHVHEQAHALLEARYLEGRVALFPDTVERRERLAEAVADLASFGCIVGALLPGMEPTVDPGPDPDRVAAEAEHIIATAQARALDILGDVDGSAAILAPQLRGTSGATL